VRWAVNRREESRKGDRGFESIVPKHPYVPRLGLFDFFISVLKFQVTGLCAVV